jgi:hypothetical protein
VRVGGEVEHRVDPLDRPPAGLRVAHVEVADAGVTRVEVGRDQVEVGGLGARDERGADAAAGPRDQDPHASLPQPIMNVPASSSVAKTATYRANPNRSSVWTSRSRKRMAQ